MIIYGCPVPVQQYHKLWYWSFHGKLPINTYHHEFGHAQISVELNCKSSSSKEIMRSPLWRWRFQLCSEHHFDLSDILPSHNERRMFCSDSIYEKISLSVHHLSLPVVQALCTHLAHSSSKLVMRQAQHSTWLFSYMFQLAGHYGSSGMVRQSGGSNYEAF